MFRLRVLGGFALEGASGAPTPPLPQHRAQAALAVLAVCGDLGCTRERLIALFWPESDDAHARHGLRDALHFIRQALGPHALLSTGQHLRLNPTVVGSDVLTFSQARASSRHADAARAYAGPLLAGFHVDDAPDFERWLDGERSRLAREYGEALEQLARAAEGTGAWNEAAAWWARAVEHDPLNSHLVLRQVEALVAIGDRANAIKLADDHARRLRDELELEPDREVLARIERIRRGETPAARGIWHGPPRPPAGQPQPAEKAPRPADWPGETTGAAVSPLAPGRTAAESTHRWAPWGAAAVAVVVLAAAFALRHRAISRAAEVRPLRTAIAVLPFQNLSVDTAHAYFAAGLHDELLAQLARVAALKVIGRTSVSGYQQTSKPLRQIGQELAAGSIVEASVQVLGNRLRVIVQLVDPVTEAHLWTESYDRTLDDAFAVQSDIARQIVAAVGATLTSAEAGAIAAAPTRNTQAYDYYLQGLDYWRRPGFLRQNFESAQKLYERALALDAAFAQAHAALSVAHSAMHNLGYDRSPTRLDLARREAGVALRIAPDLPQAHVAAGLTRIAAGDNRGTLEEFNIALRGAPNDADLWTWIGNTSGALGNWDSAWVAYDHAQRLDPRNANLFHSMGNAYHYFHRYREAIGTYRREIALAPDVVQARLSLAWSYILWKGELDTLRAVLRALPLDADPGLGGAGVAGDRLALLLMERRPDSVLALLRVIPWAVGGGADAILARASWAAPAYILQGDTAAARALFESAAAILDSQERAHPDELHVHVDRGAVLGWLGRRAEALREARWLRRSGANRGDPDLATHVALILMRVGDFDAALAEIERALAGPSLTTVHMLRLFPIWDPIRNDPRFQALLVKYAEPKAL